MRKIIFLDVDGVLNSHAWWDVRPKLEPGHSREDFIRNEFDPVAVERLHRLLDVTGAEVVLSSVWRLGEDSQNDVRKHACNFVDVTGRCTSGIRGAEIYMWIREHVPHHHDEGVLKYAIIDDDSDMLLWQKDNFFQTDYKIGLTDELVDRIIKHFEI